MKRIILNFPVFIGFTILFLLILKGCNSNINEINTIIPRDYTLAEKLFADIKCIADEAYTGSLQTFIPSISNSILGGCVTITHDTTVNPKKLMITFRNDPDCIGLDGSMRNGKITVTYKGNYYTTQDSILVNFENYSVNNNLIDNSGYVAIYNLGRNGYGNFCFRIRVNANIHKSNNGGTIHWVSDKNFEWFAGEGTPIRNDDIYMVTGDASGSCSNGKSWQINVTDSLQIHLNCKWITRGDVKIKAAENPEMLLDYGNGGCDGQATLNLNGKDYFLSL